MKFKIITLLGILFGILLIGESTELVSSNLELSGKTIIIDPGHGGKDSGTLYKDILEKDLNLKISLYLSKELEKQGASVILTRDGDYDLSTPNAMLRKRSDFDNRIKLINNSNGDLYLSIHLNYLGDSRYSGGQIFYDKKNKELAQTIQDRFNSELRSRRVVKNIPKGLYMYKQLKIKGVLIECGFLSNYNERNKLITYKYQKQLAKVITKGVIEYFRK